MIFINPSFQEDGFFYNRKQQVKQLLHRWYKNEPETGMSRVFPYLEVL